MRQDRSLKRQNIEDIIGLTPMQQGMLFHYLKNPKGSEYFEQVCIRLKGDIRIEAVERAWSYVAQCNEMLRTVYRWEKIEVPVQIVQREYEVPVKYVETREKDEAEKLVKEIREKDKAEGIDISSEPFRITVIKLGEDEAEMIITNHHILYDGWSSGVIVKEFIEAYESILEGKESVKRVKPRFKEYVKWQQGQNKEEQLRYWKDYLEGYEEKAVIAGCRTGKEKEGKTAAHYEELEPELKSAIEKICREEKVTMATVINTAWGILLQWYNNTEDTVFGITVSGRAAKLEGIEEAVGLYINTLPIRVKTENKERIDEVLRRIERDTREREAYESLSLTEIQGAVEAGGGENLFDTLVVIENYPIDKRLIDKKGKVKVEIGEVKEETNYDITIGVMLKDRIGLSIFYKEGKYDEEGIKRVAGHLKNILWNISENSKRSVEAIDMISKEERHKLLYEFNDTYTDYPRDKTIHEMFEEQAARTPDNVAVVYEDQQLTYRELNERANRLARILREKGVVPDSIVGIIVERSIEMIIGIMGILKAGGAYLPINPEYPGDRVNYMIADSKAKVVLTQSKFMDRIEVASEIINLDDADIYTFDSTNIENNVKSNNAAYVIYTSGSTGKPKGVVVEHRALHNFLNTIYERFKREVGDKDRCLSLTNISFDVGVGEIFLPLAYGATLVLFENDKVLDIRKLAHTIVEEKITFAYIPPTILKEVCELLFEQKGDLVLNKMLVGVEPIKDYVLEECMSLNENMQVINGYGPTEATICATMYNYGDKEPCGRNVSIGSPLLNTQIYILDSSGKPVPVGIAGELCISGDNLARGYLYRPELTDEKFVNNPFEPDERMYRTGDLARWLPYGNIEFLGRIDQQVKIRGYRIELGEIENQLLKHAAIKEAVVIVRGNNSISKYLCAYIAIDRKLLTVSELTVTELRRHLSRELPEFMIPSSFVQLDKIPLNENGKVDRAALPELAANINTGTAYKAARNQTEQKLTEIWEKVLGLERVGIYDNFFELGGHSLKAMQIVNRIHKVLNKQISFEEFFNHQTIASLGEYLESNKNIGYEEIERLPRQDHYALSYAQKRLWILHQREPANTAYNIAGRMLFNEGVNIHTIEKTFAQLIERHESLRTRFISIEGKPVQIIEANIEFKVSLKDLSKLEWLDKQRELEAIHTTSSEYKFDLKKAPLLTAELVKLNEDAYELVLCMHHIISDGWSMNLLREEFTRLYEANRNGIEIELAPLEIQYKDFAAWQNKQIEGSSKMEKAKSYWYEQLKDKPFPLDISHRYQGEPLKDKTGATYRMVIEKELKEKLKALAKERQTSLFMVLLSVLNILLMDLTDKNDILIGTPGSGRDHESLEKIIGYFINTTILRNQVYENESFEDVLTRVKNNTLNALEYQDFPIEKIVEEFNIKYPQITIFFNMLNMVDSESHKEDQKITYEMEVLKVIKFDLVLYVTEYSDEIEIICLYVKELFKPSRMASIMSKYAGLLERIAENPNKTVLDYLD